MNAWVSVVTTLVAVYGAVLSTYLLRDRLRENRRSIRVSLSENLFTFGNMFSDYSLFINAGNAGKRPVTITSVDLQLSNGRSLDALRPNSNVILPHELCDGGGCNFSYPIVALKKAMSERGMSGSIRLRAQIYDATGEVFTSKWRTIKID